MPDGAFGPGRKKNKHETRTRSVVLFPEAVWTPRVKLFAFSYADLAAWCGVKTDTIKKAVSRGKLDPTSFDSIVTFREKGRGKG